MSDKENKEKVNVPVCDKCGKAYDPGTFNTERTMLIDGQFVQAWLCDCGNWVNLSKCEWQEVASFR